MRLRLSQLSLAGVGSGVELCKIESKRNIERIWMKKLKWRDILCTELEIG